MGRFQTLGHYMEGQPAGDATRSAVAPTILCIAAAAIRIRNLVAQGRLAGHLDAGLGENADGDVQKKLDVVANDYLIESLRGAPVRYLASEELDQAMPLDGRAPLAVVVDPLDGSSNIDTNVAVGTIFSVLPAADCDDPEVAVLQPGANQLAAGYCLYGPQTSLVLSVGAGTHIFTLDSAREEFYLTAPDVRVTETTREFAINASNHRHWDRHIRAYIDDCLDGEEGLRMTNYNMRWIASLVAECHRILSRGGIFLYPGDARAGYGQGRLRLLYECNPVAFLIEQAGGGATTGQARILDLIPQTLHQRVPMIFGSSRETQRVERYYGESDLPGQRSPLFNKRGLYRPQAR